MALYIKSANKLTNFGSRRKLIIWLKLEAVNICFVIISAIYKKNETSYNLFISKFKFSTLEFIINTDKSCYFFTLKLVTLYIVN